jgi:uncharacterized RDD family membrane protein YckC
VSESTPPTANQSPPEPASYWVQPEPVRGPAPGFQYAGFWIRLAGYLLDAIPLLVVSLLLLVPLFASAMDVAASVPRPPAGVSVDSPEYRIYQQRVAERMTEAMSGMSIAIGFIQLFSIAYFVGFWTWRGQTPGMMLLGLRVARDTDGANPGFGRSLVRYVGYIVSSIALYIGFIWVAFDPRKQGWHDKMAGTVVVRRAT